MSVLITHFLKCRTESRSCCSIVACTAPHCAVLPAAPRRTALCGACCTCCTKSQVAPPPPRKMEKLHALFQNITGYLQVYLPSRGMSGGVGRGVRFRQSWRGAAGSSPRARWRSTRASTCPPTPGWSGRRILTTRTPAWWTGERNAPDAFAPKNGDRGCSSSRIRSPYIGTRGVSYIAPCVRRLPGTWYNVNTPASPVAWKVVRVPMKINFVGSSLTECMLVGRDFFLQNKRNGGKRGSVSYSYIRWKSTSSEWQC